METGFVERRSPNRPHPGALQSCPHCGSMMRFDEHFVITSRGITIDKAAWTCNNPHCLYEEFVRAEDRQ